MKQTATAKKLVEFLCFAFMLCLPWSLFGMQFCTLVGLAACLVLWCRDGAAKPNSLDIAVIIYLSAVAFSLLGSPDVQFDLLRSTSFWPVAAYFMFRAGTERTFKSGKLFQALSLTIIAVSIYTIFQAFYGFDIMRWSEPLSYPNPGGVSPYAAFGLFNRHHTFAASLAMLTLLCIPMLVKDSMKYTILLQFSLVLTAAIAIFMAQSRAVFIALPCAVMLLFLAGMKKHIVTVAVIASFAIVPALLILFSDSATQRVFSPLPDDARPKIMQAAAVLESERPLNGWGFGHFYRVADNGFDLIQPDVYVRSGTHNDFQQMLFDGGIPLAFAYVLLLLTVLHSAWGMAFREKSQPAAGILAAMLLFGIYSLFHNALADGELAFLFWALAGALSTLKKQVSC